MQLKCIVVSLLVIIYSIAVIAVPTKYTIVIQFYIIDVEY